MVQQQLHQGQSKLDFADVLCSSILRSNGGARGSHVHATFFLTALLFCPGAIVASCSAGTNYVETLRVQVHANCRIRRIYFSDRLYSEEELPPE
jgi:hypothetical protein